jgi:beta-glucosidase
MVSRKDFSPDFLWGTATAAYQIEGAIAEDGKGESNWDRFCREPGAIVDGTRGDIACDHYHRWREDVKHMEWLGVNAYRFSICWSRIHPDGRSRVNRAGLDFYARLIDTLLERGITPLVTLWHGEHPQALDDKGGWAHRDMIARYADYASVLFENLGDRVRNWITLNEPNCFLYQGFGEGKCPPGVKDWKQAYQAVHHALVGHGEAVQRLRALRNGARVGITMSCMQWSPASEAPEDVRAAELADLQNNRWLLDPLHGKGYPATYVEYLGDLVPEVRDGDLETMAVATDFLGVNYYQDLRVRAGTMTPERSGKAKDVVIVQKLNDAGAFRRGLERLNRLYGPRTFIVTENGLWKTNEELDAAGRCDDQDRVAYLRSHVAALREAVAAGVDVRGYCIWTLMDNFEWSAGHTYRYGLYYTDYPTQARIPKSSAQWYRQFLRDA